MNNLRFILINKELVNSKRELEHKERVL